ncbi:gamma-glutamylcyclotransferase [Tropicimonas sp. IMCC6043]|uniref:gamma-glutamylcyclotransferase n=1 Tax=Tropicimonas sp. IMCC6043 TaxID=2510645 RepID=UPI00101CAA9E|nr:gamma-glutamylcyclotransferase [Tropicimonas sp. IMCC6043]RYH10271.1 NUDIX domain-containing protein [Tropicimonas sp. IMCC6043]
MDPIFLYGTLCHEPLLRVVLGRPMSVRPARLPGHAVRWVAGESFPMILEAPDATAEGLLVVPSDATARARMDYYEQAFGYRPEPVEVATEEGPVRATLYRPPATGLTPGAPWDLTAWAERWGAVTCVAAEEVLQDMDTRPAAEVARRFGPLRARAQARVNAQVAVPTTLRRPAAPEDVQVRRRQLCYANFFSVEEYELTHRRFSGGFSEQMNRAAFVSGDAVTVLPYDPVRDRVLLVEQFRAGPLARGDVQPWLLEPIAGRIDGGETAEEAAFREAQEEARLALRELRRVGQYYPTPGANTEYLYAFLATADLPDAAAGLGGLETEAEDIRSHVITFSKAMELLDSGEINVGPLILLLLQLARLRTDWRAAASATG